MYDPLTTRYSFSCPHRGEARVLLSGFRRLDELPGSHHPTVYRIEFECTCGELHPGLVPHDELDWAPLGLSDRTSFVNLMTSRRDPLSAELGDIAVHRIRAGEWPWSFYCWPEERPRPVFPSAFWLLAAEGGGERLLIAVRCPACGRLSVNLVSRVHVDTPFRNDRDVGVLTRLLDDGPGGIDEGLRLEALGAGLEPRRLEL